MERELSEYDDKLDRESAPARDIGLLQSQLNNLQVSRSSVQPKLISHIDVSLAVLRPSPGLSSFQFQFWTSVSKLSQTWLSW